MSESPNLELPFLAEAQAQKHVTVNDALRRLDSVVQLSVEDRGRTEPPAAPDEGARYIIGAGAAGVWAGRALQVAAYIDGFWTYFAPQPGWLAFVKAENAVVYHDGSDWAVLQAVAAQETVSKFGINATADDTNRLVVSGDAALFVPASSGDVRVKLSKANTGAVASHLFQNNFNGRAEFGLLGSDDFSLKVSADGNTFVEALRVAHDTATVDFAQMPTVAGAESFAFSVASRQQVQGISVPVDVKLVCTRGYAAEGDGGGALYERVAALPSDGLGMADAAGGFWALLGDAVTARQAGAVGDGVADDTAALRRALSSGRSVHLGEGTFLVSDTVEIAAEGQGLVGTGRGRTVLQVEQTFALGGQGVIRLAADGASLEALTVAFDQTGASARGDLRQYPPAVDMRGARGCRLRALRVECGWVGVDARNDCAGALLDDIECGTFHVGVRLGGSTGTVSLRNVRVQPYKIAQTPALNDIYADGATIGLRIGRVDDLQMIGCMVDRARVILEASSAPGGVRGASGAIVGLALQGGRLEMSDGAVAISGLRAAGGSGAPTLTLDGGELLLSDFVLGSDGSAAGPLVLVDGADARLQAQGGAVTLAGPQDEGLRVDNGRLVVGAVQFSLPGGLVRTGACLRQVGGSLTAYGNTVEAADGGEGPFIAVATNADHAVFGNNANGWSLELPVDRSAGLYGPNLVDGQTVMDLALIGYGAGGDPSSVAVGEQALGVVTTGTENTAVGEAALAALTTGDANVAVGTGAGATMAGASDNTLVGQGAGATVTGDGNTGVGCNVFAGAPAGISNASAIGEGATVTGADQVQLGNAATTTFAYGAVQARSDARDKADVRDTVLGLDFVMALRPVDYRWDYREDYERPARLPKADAWRPPEPGSMVRRRFHHGFLAQDVARLIEESGVDFGGYQDHARTGGKDVKSLGYTELIAPLVKAVQELAARIGELERRS